MTPSSKNTHALSLFTSIGSDARAKETSSNASQQTLHPEKALPDGHQAARNHQFLPFFSRILFLRTCVYRRSPRDWAFRTDPVLVLTNPAELIDDVLSLLQVLAQLQSPPLASFEGKSVLRSEL